MSDSQITNQPSETQTGAIATTENANNLNGPFPAELTGWNWGAFLLTWLWGFGNGVRVALFGIVLNAFLAIIIGFGLIIGLFYRLATNSTTAANDGSLGYAMLVLVVTSPIIIGGLLFAVYLGRNGNQLAWTNHRFGNIEEFKLVQKNWGRIGFAFTVLSILLFVGGGYYNVIAAKNDAMSPYTGITIPKEYQPFNNVSSIKNINFKKIYASDTNSIVGDVLYADLFHDGNTEAVFEQVTPTPNRVEVNIAYITEQERQLGQMHSSNYIPTGTLSLNGATIIVTYPSITGSTGMQQTQIYYSKQQGEWIQKDFQTPQ